ncbi:helix-turn-helix domain-containing protein [Streptomyces youssoufiensis]
MSDEPTPHRTQRFAEYIRRAAIAAGYDITSPRGGGKKALAEAAGMGQSSVGRMLAGQTMPDAAQLEPLARALKVPLAELLVLSGIVSRDALPTRPAPPTPVEPMSAEEAASTLGIRTPSRIGLFTAMVAHLQEEEKRDSTREEAG